MLSAWYEILFLVSLLSGTLTVAYFLANLFYGRRRSRRMASRPGDPTRVTIVIPVHREDPSLFRRCLAAAARQGAARVVVVGDGCDHPYRELAREAGATFRRLSSRGGKKRALALGLEEVETPYVLFLDSDTILPPGGVMELLAEFQPGVGGVGANLRVSLDGRFSAYCAEFVERAREVVLRAMSSRGSVMLLDGACAMYPTDLIRPFVRSSAFLDLTIWGRPTPLGDDWLLTGHVLRQGLRVKKAYGVSAWTRAPPTLGGFVKQNVRWARSGWIRFGRDLRDGTLRRAGSFFAFEMVATYLLPLVSLTAFAARIPFLHRPQDWFASPLSPFLAGALGLRSWPAHAPWALVLRGVVQGVELLAVAGFVLTVVRNLREEKWKVALGGLVATPVLFAATIYGLFTVWRVPDWRNTPTPGGMRLAPRAQHGGTGAFPIPERPGPSSLPGHARGEP